MAGAVLVITVRAATPTVAEFFDDSQVQSIYLTINSRDWQSLKDHYLDNDYYPCDFKWRDQVVRNVGIRSRGTGSRRGVKARTAGRFRPFHDEADVSSAR